MLKFLVNDARLTLRLATTGPVLIKSGHATLSGPDMTPVLTYRGGDWQVYLPGSSLKGVFRSHLERICRTLRNDPPVVCDPFLRLRDRAEVDPQGQLVCDDYPSVSCGNKFEVRQRERLDVSNGRFWRRGERLSNQRLYADSCPICRLFGSTSYIGRVSIGDAYLSNATRPRPTEIRDGVGIDRLTGGSYSRAKFELEVVASETIFETELVLRNFEIWQLGMLMLVVQDLADGLIRIGSGRSRGLGAVTGALTQMQLSFLGQTPGRDPREIWGLGKFLADRKVEERYGSRADDYVTLDQALPMEHRGIRQTACVEGDDLQALHKAAVAALIQRIEGWDPPELMASFQSLQFTS